MAKRMSAGSNTPPPRDFGPAIRLKVRAAAEPSLPSDASDLARRQAAAAAVKEDLLRCVMKEDRRDPANSAGGMVRGARIRDPLRKMHEGMQISDRQWIAAEAFRDDVALADGARVNQVESAGVRSAMSNRNWPSDTQLDALQRVFDTLAGFKPRERRILIGCLIEHRPLRDLARSEAIRDSTASEVLQAVLNQLALCHRTRQDQS